MAFMMLVDNEQTYTKRNNAQTTVINMTIKRMLKNKVHLLDVSYVSTYIFREASVRNRSTVTTKFQFKISNQLAITMTEAEKNLHINNAN